MKDTPIKKEIVDQKIIDNNIADVGKASIRVIKKLVDEIERESGSRFVRMEMGVPG